MRTACTQQPLNEISADLLILPLYQGARPASEVDQPLGGGLGRTIDAGDFTGEYGQTLIYYTDGRIAARRVMLLGLGAESRLDRTRLRRAAGIGARAARQRGGTVAVLPPQVPGLTPAEAAQFTVEGIIHSLHQMRSLKSDQKRRPEVEQLLVAGGADLEPAVHKGQILAEAANFARDLAWLPGNHLTACDLANRAAALGEEAGIEVEIYDLEGCRKLGLGLLLAVNQGSRQEPRFIVMRYKGSGGKGPWLGLVGKGITFDSGGISIKPTDHMWDMKYDMCGAAAVLGAMQAISKLKPACDILAVIPATDNMPDGGAYKPGDVVVGYSGKSVEIRSTDAEGRLILADGLAYAAAQGCTRLITASTLTGAARIALGSIRFGIVSNDDQWEEQVYSAAEEAGEKGWRLPHDREYYDLFKSPIADMANSGEPRAAGTVVGGLFLMSHVGGTPCVHLDIAAVAYRNSDDRYQEAGPTGVGVRTMVQAALRFAGGKR